MAPGLIAEQIAVTGESEMPRRPKPGKSFGHVNGFHDAAEDALNVPNPGSLFPTALTTAANDEVHDMVCIGFGPAAVGIAVALHDMHEAEETLHPAPKVRFLERQDAFYWHAGMLLPGAKMQISFIKDLATLRDPCSYFTFLNYLKEHERLAQFTNLSTFLPSRLEFEDYMRWVADHFSDVVDYSQGVERIRPVRSRAGHLYDCLEVSTRNSKTGELTTRLSKNVVVAVGGKANKPPMFQKLHNNVLHTSEYQVRIGQVLPDPDKAYSVAVVGSGQSAAEVFNDLHARYPNASTKLIMRDTAMRPSDDSPFVNEIFNPEAVDSFYRQPDGIRAETLKRNKATNYSVVRLELLEHIYESLYMQCINEPDKSKWQHQILNSREIVDVQQDVKTKQINLVISHLAGSGWSNKSTEPFDAVILATGYKRDAHVEMLNECQNINGSTDGSWVTSRDYSLKLDRSKVQADVGIWLQGCNEQSHGLADSLLSIVATRSGELVQSIFGYQGPLDGA
jgi:L-ornithine N5-monooxygenase